MSETKQGVAWTLTRAPDIGRLAYRAVATCPHGQTEHTLFGTRERIEKEQRGLNYSHTTRRGCRCPLGSLEIL